MDRDALRQRLMVTFLGELEEHVQALNRDLLALERDPNDSAAARHTALFRTAHSLKGAARSVNVQPIEAACHHLETLLGQVRDGRRPMDAQTLQFLFTATDALEDAQQRLRAGQDLSDSPLHRLLPALDQAARRTVAPAQPTTEASPAVLAPEPAPIREGFVRIPAEKLDHLQAGSGELLIARRRAASPQETLSQLRNDLRQSRSEWLQLERPLHELFASEATLLPKRAALAFERTGQFLKSLEHRIDQLVSRTATDHHALERAAASLEDDIRSMRMFPFAHACEGLERTVRDLAHAADKQVSLVIEGGDIELDRFILDSLKDPLLHLVRNAVDHGVELPDERRAAGKPPRATVRVAAALRGGGVEIVVADDGRSLDVPAIRERARRKSMMVPESDRDAARLIFMPGFSTAPLVTELSGRGMGLEIVKHRVELLHGEIDFAFEPGRGTRMVLTVPLTLTRIRALIIGAAGQVFAIPLPNVRGLRRVTGADVAATGGRDMLISTQAPIPIAALGEILRIDGASSMPTSGKAPLVIVASGNAQVAVVVDELIAEEEVLVKGLGSRLRRVRHVTGATILPSGRVALILNVADVVDTALRRVPTHALSALLEEKRSQTQRRLLVVDDSVTTRTLERSILEAAGYEVIVAVDGNEAWRLLQSNGADLVVADVEMPGMDGVALCQTIRRSPRFRELPVVLVTALESDDDKKRGLDAGADAYLTKSAFDQRQLLETIMQLL